MIRNYFNLKLYRMMILLFFLCTPVSAQNFGTISGTVIDARTKQPLFGANVLVLDSSLGSSTDANGNFTIRNVPVGTYRLRFDFIGYESVLKTDIVVVVARPIFVNVEMNESFLEGEQVTVTAGYFVEEMKVQPSTLGLSSEEIRRFPGGFEDVVRTVATLPGVTINGGGGRNDLLVRGGGPSENLYIINDIEVPNINHFSTQGTTGGSLSFLNLEFVEDITFSTGGFGAQYGDKMSSVLKLEMKDENPENFEGELVLSATQYGLNFEQPIKNKGNLIVSARRSYLDLIFRAANLPFIPVYTDFNILMHYELSPRDKVFLLGLSAIDEVDRDQSSEENRVFNATLLDNTQYKGISGINYQRRFDQGYLDLTLSANLSRYRLSQFDSDEVEYFKSKADEWEYGLKATYYWVATKYFGLRSGASVKYIRNENSTAFADTIYDRSGNRIPVTQLGFDQADRSDISAEKYALFMEADWRVHPRLALNFGVRSDFFTFLNRSHYLSPRLSIKVEPFPRHSLRLSGGIYYQSPSYVWVINPENERLRSMQNRMGILSWDYLVREDMRFSVESYYKDYRDLPTGTSPGVTDYIIQTNTGANFGGREDDFQSFGYYPLVSEARGHAYGVELFLRKKYSDIPLYAQFSLTYNRSEFTANNGRSYPGLFDQRFILNLSGGYIFNANWEISAKFRYFTGVPYTPVYRPSENAGQVQNLPDEYLSGRLRAGHHLDVRVDRFINFKSWTMILYLDIQNIYNFKIPQRPVYDFWEDEIVRSNAIGILPSIGIRLQL